jgi:hypothetical protein
MAIPLNSNPITDSQDYDTIAIAGVTCPGWCKLSGFDRPYEWDVKKGKGVKGSTTTLVSLPPAEGSITFFAWLASHFEDWNDFLPLLKYDPTKKQGQAFEVYHPLLVDLEIHSLVCKKIGIWTNDGKGYWSRQVDFLEYYPAPKQSAVSTPTSAATTNPSDPNAIGVPPDPALEAAKKEFVDEIADAKSKGAI